MPTLTLGPYTLRAIETGSVWLDGGSMFGSVPKPLWMRNHPADERNRIELSMRCLLIEGEGRRVLVDVGAGDKMSPKLVDIYRLEHDRNMLERSLQALGLTAEDVTDVLLTHLHFDHAGGSTRQQGDRLAPAFPRARYHLQRRNWDNANAPNLRERASYMPENFRSLMECGVLTLWDGAQSPWAGIELLPIDGHTIGQQMVRVAGGGEALYFVADLIPMRSHVRLPYIMGYDMCAQRTLDEKRALLDRAAGEGAWIALEHDPLIAFARPRRSGEDFEWGETVSSGVAPGDPNAKAAGGAGAAAPGSAAPGTRATGAARGSER